MGRLVISNENDCHRITERYWSSIVIEEDTCNELTGDLVIANNPCIQSIKVKAGSLGRVNSLNLLYLPELTSFESEATTFHNTTQVEMTSCIYSCYSLDIPNLSTLSIGSMAFFQTQFIVLTSFHFLQLFK